MLRSSQGGPLSQQMIATLRFRKQADLIKIFIHTLSTGGVRRFFRASELLRKAFIAKTCPISKNDLSCKKLRKTCSVFLRYRSFLEIPHARTLNVSYMLEIWPATFAKISWASPTKKKLLNFACTLLLSQFLKGCYCSQLQIIFRVPQF